MDIIITERQEKLLESYIVPAEMRERAKRVNDEKMELENFIESNGEYMTDITNGKTYLVQYLKALSDLVGKKYAMCAPVRQDGTYGAFYVKPFETFRQSYANGNRSGGAVQKPIKKNLYQQMMLAREDNNY